MIRSAEALGVHLGAGGDEIPYALTLGATMRLVYVDEAGISDPKQEPFTVVVGVIVQSGEALKTAEARLRSVVAKHIPPQHVDGFVLHVTDLFNGNGNVFGGAARWPVAQRLALAHDIAAIPRDVGARVAIGHVERGAGPFLRRREKHSRAELTADGLVTAFAECAMRVEKWMREHAGTEDCGFVVEDNDQMRQAIKDVCTFFQSSDSIEGWSSDERLEHQVVFPFERIRGDPLFARKQHGNCLELADFCAFVAKRCRMDASDDKYKRFLLPWQDCIV